MPDLAILEQLYMESHSIYAIADIRIRQGSLISLNRDAPK